MKQRMPSIRRRRYVHHGDGKRHKYRFAPERHFPTVKWGGSPMALDVEGIELIETEVHWLIKTDNGSEFHAPKEWYVKE